MDYEIYTIRIKNNTDRTIMLDTRQKTDTTFIRDDKNNKFESFLYENKENDLILKPQEAKTIQIKFNDAYRSNINITSINFTDIVDYEEYKNNSDITQYELKIEI